MEAHHHSHSHGRKDWKSLLFEFFMLFFAVFCASIAEYWLEHYVEHNHAVQYMESMQADLKMDTANIHRAIKFNRQKVRTLDTMSKLLNQPGALSAAQVKQVYDSASAIFSIFVVPFSSGTITQLKYSGGLRTIRSRQIADSLMDYDASVQQLHTQSDYYNSAAKECMTEAYTMMDISYMLRPHAPDRQPVPMPGFEDHRHILANKVLMFEGIVGNYVLMLKVQQQNAEHLMIQINREYDFK